MKGSDESVTAATEEGIDEVIASRLVSWQKIPKKASSIYFLGKARGMPPTFLLAVSYVTQAAKVQATLYSFLWKTLKAPCDNSSCSLLRVCRVPSLEKLN